jgi:DNA polymerase I-like protein with 3'-5' exonuclease and polymerase domains
MKKVDFTLDIETTIPATKMRVGGLRDVKTGMNMFFTDLSGMLAALANVKRGQRVGTWNGARFDFPKIDELLEFSLDVYFVEQGIIHVDGLLAAKLLMPDHTGSYSLGAMAKHFYPGTRHYHKDPVADMTQLEKEDFYNNTPLPELTNYLEQDLLVTEKVVNKLIVEKALSPSAKWDHPLKIEQAVAEIIQRQVVTGVNFNQARGEDLYTLLGDTRAKLDKELAEKLPKVAISAKRLKHPPKQQFKKDGKPTIAIQRYCDLFGWEIVHTLPHESFGGYFAKRRVVPVGEVSINQKLPLTAPLVLVEQLEPGQTALIKQHLLELGWKPTMYNRKKDELGRWKNTSPMLSDPKTKEPCPNLKKVGAAWVKTLIARSQTQSKLSLLRGSTGKTGLLVKSETQDDEFIMRSDADTCGTPTARFRHRGIVNIPRTGSFMGREFRSLFMARDDMVMVGWDAEGLEARMEAHYVHPFDPVYADSLVNGNSEDGTDIHTLNWKALDLRSRDDAKTFKYAITYGARPKKIAESLGVRIERAQMWYDRFWAANEGLFELNKSLEHEWFGLGSNHLLGLDGRLITTRKAHALLNSKLQGGGAVVMKHALIIADARLSKLFPREHCHGLIRMHDEEQWECLPEMAEEVGKIGCQSVVDAGIYLGLRVPMAASYKVGINWSETH